MDDKNVSGLFLEFERWMLDMRDPQRNMLKALEKIKNKKDIVILKKKEIENENNRRRL